MSLTHFAPAANLLWKYLESEGIDPEPLYRKAGIAPELLHDPGARINVSRVDTLWQQAALAIEGSCFAVKMAQFWHPSQIGALGYAWLASSTLRRAFKRVDRYIHVVTEDLDLQLSDIPAGLKVSIDMEGSIFTLPQHHDLVLSILMHMCRFNFGDELVATQVSLAHPELECSKQVIDYFRTDIQFDAEQSGFTIARGDADRVLPSANRQIALMHDEMLTRYLIEIKQGDIVQQVKSIILENLPDGAVTDKLVAKQLNMSERSLQRRLQENQTTFRSILEGVREMMAKQYIKNPMNQMGDVAFLLGFSEQSAFSRAFKKWTGLSPLEYRNTR
ncbi:MAG TPA: AraC family transcriptional regulator [Gammaproteobacteria bacterium]|nr:AraC family transcriptional regulator [Gammaproteobacteria bacterium]